ncbi:PREDICTED: fibroin heavy chain-like [Bactrocera latifrons]|uniref:fibroin heavy chain-like n=1 Tax=Bactrocera latifrons TaxID=174628 RepID=UPI0008DC8E1D|nr:PREDICTED: fibroin heavy chain-like [Bactrocera latifrons]
MKLFLVAFALIATAAADVSHLNREYLPPVQPGHHGASSHYSAVGGSAGFGSSGSSHFGAPSGSVSSSGSFGAIGGSANFGISSGASAGHSGSVSYSSQQPSHDNGHGQQSETVHVSYDSAPVAPQPAPAPEQEPEPIAAAPVEDDAAVSYGSYGQDEVQQQYEGAAEVEQQQLDAGVSIANDDAGVAFGGSYDLSSQDAGVQYFDHNTLLTDSYGNNVGAHESHVSLAAAQGPAIRSPQPASFSHAASHDVVQQYVSAGAGAGAGTSSGVETQYGSNGGYIY